jgi:hypothetical protein
MSIEQPPASPEAKTDIGALPDDFVMRIGPGRTVAQQSFARRYIESRPQGSLTIVAVGANVAKAGLIVSTLVNELAKDRIVGINSIFTKRERPNNPEITYHEVGWKLKFEASNIIE